MVSFPKELQINSYKGTNKTYSNREQLKESKGIRRICFCLPHMYAVELEGEMYFDFWGNLDVLIV